MRKKVTINEIRNIADSFIRTLLKESKREQALVVGLYGELGSGKTVFTKEAAKILNVKEHVVSPTFVIERIYHIQLPTSNFKHLIHIDAYRLEHEDELLKLGWEDILKDSRNLIFIEWADKVSKILPKDHIKIYFRHIDENTREIEITKT